MRPIPHPPRASVTLSFSSVIEISKTEPAFLDLGHRFIFKSLPSVPGLYLDKPGLNLGLIRDLETYDGLP